MKCLHCRNHLQTTDSIKELSGCSQLSVLDLSENCLEEPGVYDILESMPELHVLCLANNNIVRGTKDYRFVIQTIVFAKLIA